MQKRSKEVEKLRRLARHRPEWAFRHNAPRFCSICKEDITSALDIHMSNSHVELGQLWRCPVEWCAVWKGSVSDCLGHLHEKHLGSEYVAIKNIAKFFPRWMVTRDVRMFRASRWMRNCFKWPDVAWCTSTGSTRTPSLIRHSEGECFLDYCRLWAGLWPSPSSHIYAFLFLRRELPWARYQRNVSRVACLHGC